MDILRRSSRIKSGPATAGGGDSDAPWRILAASITVVSSIQAFTGILWIRLSMAHPQLF